MIKCSSLINFFQYFTAVVFVYANESWMIYEYKVLTMGLQLGCIITCIVLQLALTKKISPPNPVIIFLAIYPFFCKLLNLDKNSDVTNTVSVSVIYLTLGCLSISNLRSLLDKYARVTFFLCIITVVLGPITLFNYSILSHLPIHYNHNFIWDDLGYYNLLVFTERYVQDFRTQSIYWEPGAWSFNLIFAFYWLIIEKEEYKKLPYLLFGILLACSTTGLVLLLIIIFHLLPNSKDGKVRKRVTQYFIVSTVLIASALVYITYTTNLDIGGILYDQTIGKITGSSEATGISFNQRTESTQLAFAIALRNPFFGIGKLGVEDILFVTSSLAEVAYQLGLVYLVIYIIFFRKLFNKLNILLSFLFAIILLNGEPYSYWILCSLILIFGSKMAVYGARYKTNVRYPISEYNMIGAYAKFTRKKYKWSKFH